MSTTSRLAGLLTVLVVSSTVASCGAPRREAIIPVPPDHAVTRALRILESFDYTVVEVDRTDGVVRGTRGDGRQPEVLWEVTVHVTPEQGGTVARYRLESRATSTVEMQSRRSSESDLPSVRINRVPPSHLDEILMTLANR